MDELIAEDDAAINQFLQRDLMSPPKYSQELWSKELKCGTVYNEALLKGIFIEDLQASMRQSVRNYWGKNSEDELQYEVNGKPPRIRALRCFLP